MFKSLRDNVLVLFENSLFVSIFSNILLQKCCFHILGLKLWKLHTCKDQASYAESFRIFKILAKPLFRNFQSFSSCFWYSQGYDWIGIHLVKLTPTQNTCLIDKSYKFVKNWIVYGWTRCCFFQIIVKCLKDWK